MKTSLSLIFILLAALARVPASQQTPAGGVEHFTKDGLSFDYPAGWTLEDKSNAQVQHLVLKRSDSTALIMVVSQLDPVHDFSQLHASRAAITQPYLAHIAQQLGAEVPGESGSQCLLVAGGLAVGHRIVGRLNQEPGTGEVYPLVKGRQLIHLFYVRKDKDEAVGAAAWKTLTETLKVETPGAASPDAEKKAQLITGGVLHGKALSKPPPHYPSDAKRARAQGTVVVQIIVGENGDVVSAQAVSGHFLLRPAGVEAARRAKFTPTLLCGKPVKVTGVITYNFVLM